MIVAVSIADYSFSADSSSALSSSAIFSGGAFLFLREIGATVSVPVLVTSGIGLSLINQRRKYNEGPRRTKIKNIPDVTRD
ncbi:hypothetical protein CRI94_16310 [Longibacter salinarum]|uniref:Uncharacterized protein n=1 Tax=Longibacter salinarum TaxID=1850348 RepID=A0A2A8CUB4_9BACT|nr:hypothetical protein CRI94_16310 [Longibacter salinarum]